MTQAQKPKILIVDDVAENIHMLIELLKNDYDVIPAKDGASALKKAAGAAVPDLILLDIVMPGIDGYEVCRRLKTDSVTRDIPVIFITAVSEAMDEAKAFKIGAVDYITKPFNPPTVKARVETQIRLNRTLRDLQKAIEEIKTLSGLLPICASCKRIRDDQGGWNHLETYISSHSNATFSHGICPDCLRRHYPDHKIRNPSQ